MATKPADTQMGGHSMMLTGAKSWFCGSHQLPEYPAIHGHSYEVWAYTDREMNVESWKDALHAACMVLDHSLLNEIIPVPTMENIARYIAEKIGAVRVCVIRPVEGFSAEFTRRRLEQMSQNQEPQPNQNDG